MVESPVAAFTPGVPARLRPVLGDPIEARRRMGKPGAYPLHAAITDVCDQPMRYRRSYLVSPSGPSPCRCAGCSRRPRRRESRNIGDLCRPTHDDLDDIGARAAEREARRRRPLGDAQQSIQPAPHTRTPASCSLDTMWHAGKSIDNQFHARNSLNCILP